MCCFLSVVSSVLLSLCCQQCVCVCLSSAVCFCLPIVSIVLFSVCCQQCVVACLSSAVCCCLSVVSSVLFSVCCQQCVVVCLLSAVLLSVCRQQCVCCLFAVSSVLVSVFRQQCVAVCLIFSYLSLKHQQYINTFFFHERGAGTHQIGVFKQKETHDMQPYLLPVFYARNRSSHCKGLENGNSIANQITSIRINEYMKDMNCG